HPHCRPPLVYCFFSTPRLPREPPPFPSTTLFRSPSGTRLRTRGGSCTSRTPRRRAPRPCGGRGGRARADPAAAARGATPSPPGRDRKSTCLDSSPRPISYFLLFL